MTISEDNQGIIDRIKQLRLDHGLSQAKFAKLIGASQGNVASWETGKTFPSALALRNIALKLGCSTDWILIGNLKSNYSTFELQPQFVGENRMEYQTSPQQKNEVIFDPDLKRMTDILKEIMFNENPHMRSWAIIQFEDAFPKFCSIYDEKKQRA